ncbi:hypothetical protein H5410_009653 [Solanum commersonii]|uniref:Titin-like n=1 Tax=Solanum commersonii TaxID=4109 RepID=A0A9J6AJD3_SOLCO|nr:hypothetical protein H5410_009653 [Solanum commersonii]
MIEEKPQEPEVQEKPKEPTVQEKLEEPTIDEKLEEPATIGEKPEELAVAGKSEEPAVEVTPKPKIEEKPQESVIEEQSQEPEVKETPEEPVVKETREELAVEKKPEELATEEQVVDQKLEEPTVEVKPEEATVDEKHEEPSVEEKPEESAVENFEEPTVKEKPEEPPVEEEPEDPAVKEIPEELAGKEKLEEPIIEEKPKEPPIEEEPKKQNREETEAATERIDESETHNVEKEEALIGKQAERFVKETAQPCKEVETEIKELKDINAGDESNNNALQKEEMTLDELLTSAKEEMVTNNFEEGKVVSEIPNQENGQQANLTTEEANDAHGAENITELSSEEMRVEDCTNKVESSDFGFQNHNKYSPDADKLELQNREIDISYILDTPVEKETNGRNSEKLSESTEDLIHQTSEISEENKAAVDTDTNMLQSCADPHEQLKHQLAELREEKQAGGIADTNTLQRSADHEEPYSAPAQEIIDKSETEDISCADCLEEENSLRTNQEKLKKGENSEVKTDENFDKGDEFQSIMMLKGVEKDDYKQHIKHNTCAVMDTEEQNEDSPAGEQTSKKLEELEKIDIDDNNNINHQSTETNLPEEATESKSECVTMEIKTPIKEEEQEEDLRETTGEDSSNNNTTQVQKEEETTISEPKRVSLEPFGSERKTVAGSGEMITCNETNKIHEVRVENAPGAQVGRVPEEKTRGEQEK